MSSVFGLFVCTRSTRETFILDVGAKRVLHSPRCGAQYFVVWLAVLCTVLLFSALACAWWSDPVRADLLAAKARHATPRHGRLLAAKARHSTTKPSHVNLNGTRVAADPGWD